FRPPGISRLHLDLNRAVAQRFLGRSVRADHQQTAVRFRDGVFRPPGRDGRAVHRLPGDYRYSDGERYPAYYGCDGWNWRELGYHARELQDPQRPGDLHQRSDWLHLRGC